MRNKIIISAVFATLIGVSMPLMSFAEDSLPESAAATPNAPPMVESGTLEVEATQVRLLLGGSKGLGVLHFQGKDYNFKMTGASVGGVGVTKSKAVGIIYNLYNIKDFPGIYTGVGAGAVAVEGIGATNWQNSKGVVAKMYAESAKGLALNLGINSVSIELVE